MQNPFVFAKDNKRYHTYDYHLRSLFGEKCTRLAIDGGYTCPNRDGTCGVGGCTFCSAQGSGDFTSAQKTITAQLQEQSAILSKKWESSRYIAYFQAFTGTYAPIATLKQQHMEALAFPGVVGLSVATRADCLPSEVVSYLRELHRCTHLTVELGLQSIHDKTAYAVNRGHSYADFLRGYEKLQGLNVCVHLINGLPGESERDMLESVRTVASLRPYAVKLHTLQILRGARLAEQYAQKPFSILTMDQTVDLVCRELELLPAETVIARLSADSAAEDLIAPTWVRNKRGFLNAVDKRMVACDTWQGRCFCP